MVSRDLRTDVLVVGAGPSGSMAALELSRHGVKVLLVDRSTFPREKVCGDGLLEESLDILSGAGIARTVRERSHPVRCIRFIAPDGSACKLDGDFCTLRRSELDALLVEEACARGASFIDGMQVTMPLMQGESCKGAVGIDRAGQTVRITAPLVLLATGAASRILREFGVLQRKQSSGVGVRGYFRLRDGTDESSMVISYDRRLLPGYAWMFPLGAGVFNVGCGVFLDGRRKMPRFGQNLNGFYKQVEPLSTLLRRAEQVAPIRAATVRTGFGGARASAPGLLVLGEALGLTFPFIGEGISNALESGRVASSVAIGALERGDFSKQRLGRYEQKLRMMLDGRHRGYVAAQRWFRFTFLANLVIRRTARSQAVRRVVRQILCGETDAGEVFSLRGLARVLLFT